MVMMIDENHLREHVSVGGKEGHTTNSVSDTSTKREEQEYFLPVTLNNNKGKNRHTPSPIPLFLSST